MQFCSEMLSPFTCIQLLMFKQTNKYKTQNTKQKPSFFHSFIPELEINVQAVGYYQSGTLRLSHTPSPCLEDSRQQHYQPQTDIVKCLSTAFMLTLRQFSIFHYFKFSFTVVVADFYGGKAVRPTTGVPEAVAALQPPPPCPARSLRNIQLCGSFLILCCVFLCGYTQLWHGHSFMCLPRSYILKFDSHNEH